MNPESVKIHPSRKTVLADQFLAPYFENIRTFLYQEYKDGYTVYPEGKNIFHAFDVTPFDKVRVVILGQDPYHGVGEAH